MRVAIHIPWSLEPLPLGGTERFALELAKGLLQMGHDATLICSNLTPRRVVEGVPVCGHVPAQYRDEVRAHGGANERFFRNVILSTISDESLRRFASFVQDQLDQVPWDVVHLNGLVYSAALPSALTSRSVITSHECPQELTHYWGAPYEVFKRVLESSEAIRSAGSVSTQSLHYARLFTEHLGRPVRAIPPGVPTNIRLRQRARSSAWTLLLPARLDISQKGHDIALTAVAELLGRGRQCTLICSGYDASIYSEDYALLLRLADELGVAAVVTARRFDSISEALSLADIVVSPERFCSYGFSVVESLAAGVPTVLAPIPTYREIATGFSHARFAEAHSGAAFADAIQSVMDDSGGAHDSLEAARFRRARPFATCVRAYERLYNRLVSRR